MPEFVKTNWFETLLVASAVLLAALLMLRRRSFGVLALIAGSLALIGSGGLLIPGSLGGWVALGASAALFVAFLVVVVSGKWSAFLGYALVGMVLFGLGGLGCEATAAGLLDAGKAILNVEFIQPYWLLLLLLVPVIFFWSFRSLAGLGPLRRWLVLSLRCVLIMLLVLALAEVRLRHPNENVTVLFVLDRSLSIPKDLAADPTNPSKQIDRRWERIRDFINTAVEHRGPGHKEDRAGVIVFGRSPRLELPPAEVKRLNFQEVLSPIDNTYTDIGAAIKMALASFPEGSGKRIVLLSDGNENLGNAMEQARIAKNNGVQIDVVPLAAGYRNDNEVLVQSVEAPPVTQRSAHLPVRVLVRSYNPQRVIGKLELRQITQVEDNGKITPVAKLVPPSPRIVEVGPGLTPFTFQQTLASKDQSYTYEAIFTPMQVKDAGNNTIAEGLPGDRTENNRATTHVIAQGQRRILLIEGKAGEHQKLLENLQALGRKESKFLVHSIEAARLPQDKEELGVFLSKYDCVLLANVPADLFTEDQQEIIRGNTHEQGCGLVMIGGQDSFGAGGWQGTAVEKALPVDCDIKSIKVQGKGGLVLIMHASEMADGNVWQKKVAQLAIKKLSPMDEVGVIQYTIAGDKWHIPLQVIGSKRATLMKLVDSMIPEDMPAFDPSLKMAFDALNEPKRELATRHVIIISDGDPQFSNFGLLGKMREKATRTTVTTVGVATHGPQQGRDMTQIAKATGGRFYNVKSPKALPQIYIKETRLVSQSFIYKGRFNPKLLFKSGPTEKLPDTLPSLYGYVRTTPKVVSPPVQVPVLAPAAGGQEFPILAFWHYGLGKSVAFTSDARGQIGSWDRDWASSDMYLKFWEQVLDWSLRAVETGKMMMTTEYRDGKVRVIVDARDDKGPITNLKIRGGITTPQTPEGGNQPQTLGPLKFEQKNSGVYEAEFKADEAGSYIINAQARRPVKRIQDGKEIEIEEGVDSVRSGVTIPYSPEFADLESNADLLKRLATLTGGQVYEETAEALSKAALSGDVFRLSGLPPSRSLQPIWYWLLLLAGITLFFDVATRRLAIDPREVSDKAKRGWAHLRGRAAATVEEPVFLARLKTRKAQVAESMERERGSRRFEAPEESPVAAPAGAHELAEPMSRPVTPPKPAPRLEPKPEAEADDFASRLLKAKKRVWEDRDKP